MKNGKLTILFLGADMGVVKILQERAKSFTAEIVFVPCSNGEKIAETAAKFPPDAVLIDDGLIDPLNGPLIARLRTSVFPPGDSMRPFFLLSAERDVPVVRKIMQNGFADIFTRPVDTALFYQKLQLHMPRTPFLKDRLLFSMDVAADLSLALECRMTAASEYGLTVRQDIALSPGALFPLHGSLFGAQGGQCLGKVVSCVPLVGQENKYETSLLLIAPKKEILSAIRLWLKQEYVKSKENI